MKTIRTNRVPAKVWAWPTSVQDQYDTLVADIYDKHSLNIQFERQIEELRELLTTFDPPQEIIDRFNNEISMLVISGIPSP